MLTTVDIVLFLVTTQQGGHGIHIWNLRTGTVLNLVHWFDITAIVYTPAECLIRVSILLQYLRIFVPNRRGDRVMYYAIHILVWCNCIFYLSKFIGLLALCVPAYKLWEPWTQGGHCNNGDAWYISSGLFNIVSDFATLVLPIRCIYQLQLPTRRKILVTLVFATGFLACIASIVRTYYTFKIALGPDVTYNVVVMGLAAAAELSIGVVVSCSPVLPRFFQHIGPKIASASPFKSAYLTGSAHKVRSLHAGMGHLLSVRAGPRVLNWHFQQSVTRRKG